MTIFPRQIIKQDVPQFVLWPKVLDDIFAFRVSEQRYDHNPQLRVG